MRLDPHFAVMDVDGAPFTRTQNAWKLFALDTGRFRPFAAMVPLLGVSRVAGRRILR